MKIITTAVLLMITLLVVPVFTWFFAVSPTKEIWEVVHVLLWITGISVFVCFVLGELSGNNSQVDKIWSLLPVVYVWVVAFYGDFSPRLLMMSLLVSIWGLRLTYNFARHGAYRWQFWTGKEDYRWEVLRNKREFKPRWKWTLFNLLFISGYQNILILLFTMPIIIALQYNDAPIGILDIVAGGLMLFFIVFETIADQQQWNFQSRKWQLIRSKSALEGDYKKGFLDKGLWRYSRHPNYFAEQSIWISFYLFSIAASGQWLNWSIAGCLLLVVLFQGSSAFSEEISSSKYPEYKNYQKRVPRFLPWIGIKTKE